MILEQEDWKEPVCPLERPCSCGNPSHHHHERIPIPEIIAECDRLFNRENMEELGRHLRTWREKAQKMGDREGELTILSEMMGHYRMTGDREHGISAVRDGFALMRELGMTGTVSTGTILLNGATALKSFGETEEALNCYREAFRCYNTNLPPDDVRYAGLFNNMAAAYADTGDTLQAEVYYRKALDILKHSGGLMDSAVTHVNLAELYNHQNPEAPRIQAELECALACFNSPDAKRDGYYAHTCRKCASAFGQLGFFRDEMELNKRADEIYERS